MPGTEYLRERGNHERYSFIKGMLFRLERLKFR